MFMNKQFDLNPFFLSKCVCKSSDGDIQTILFSLITVRLLGIFNIHFMLFFSISISKSDYSNNNSLNI